MRLRTKLASKAGILPDMEESLNRLAPENLYRRHNDLSIRTHNMTDDEWTDVHAPSSTWSSRHEQDHRAGAWESRAPVE